MSDYIVVDEKLIDKLDELKIDNGKCIMLYAKILAMANNKGYTTAGNAYFGRILNLEDRQVRRHLNSLEAAGCITRYEKRKYQHKENRNDCIFCSYYLSGNPVFPYSASGGCRNTIFAFRTHFRNACSINARTEAFYCGRSSRPSRF